MIKNITIYTLELEDGYYYVGKTVDIDQRLKQHSKGKGSEWTKLHKIRKIIDQTEFKIEDPSDEDKWENFVTIKLMKEKGWKKVRGGYWCNCGEYETIKNLHHHNYFLDVKLDQIKFNLRNYTVYALKLENGKYYIGYTTNLKYALKNHSKGKASIWTKKFKPLEIIETWNYESNEGKIDMDFVDEKVYKYFNNFSAVNVRGGSFIIMDDDLHLKRVKNGQFLTMVNRQ